jgi:hypothetical protein
MTGWVRRDLPADIVVHAGDFDSQPDVFAHLLATGADLDLTHVEVVQAAPLARLRARFDADMADDIMRHAGRLNTIVLILPAAYTGLDCPLPPAGRLPRLGTWRGRIPHMTSDPTPS